MVPQIGLPTLFRTISRYDFAQLEFCWLMVSWLWVIEGGPQVYNHDWLIT